MALMEACEESLNRFLGLYPRMAPDQRDYLVAHAYCALHGLADELKFVENLGARTAGCLRTRVGRRSSPADFVRPDMALGEYSVGVIHAYTSWLSELTAARPNQVQMAFVVRRALFEGNPDGWDAYVKHIREVAPWFAQPDSVTEFRSRLSLTAVMLRPLFEARR
jgi:hypothetical protein